MGTKSQRGTFIRQHRRYTPLSAAVIFKSDILPLIARTTRRICAGFFARKDEWETGTKSVLVTFIRRTAIDETRAEKVCGHD